MIPGRVAAAVEPITGRIREVRPLSGGCIAHASRLDAERGVFFLKWAGGPAGAGFAGEAAGLRALAAAAPAGIVVPEPLAAAAAVGDEPGYLLATWIQPAPAGAGHWERFGGALAELHAAAAPTGAGGPYGFGEVTFCGPTPQDNSWSADWPAFFGERRLGTMAGRLRSAGHWRPEWDDLLTRLLARLPDILPAAARPSLVHGDLWSGNVFPAARGATAIVDPAVYVGHSEADLAMTELFGGFPPEFYAAYLEARPATPGYEERREIYNLYHLLNHLLIFGGGYASGVDGALRRVAR